MPRSPLVITLLLAGCVRALSPAAGQRADGQPEDTSTDIQSLADGDLPAPPPKPAPGLFDCATPEVLTEPPLKPRSPALSVDGLTLYVRDTASGFLAASRSAAAAPFGAWQPAPAWLSGSDLAFYAGATTERFLCAKGTNGTRRILDCATGATTCTLSGNAVTIVLPPGNETATDLDGPDHASPPGGPLLVFNAGPDGYSQSAFIATWSDNQGQWQAEGLPRGPGSANDDPTISPDGLLIVFEVPSAGPPRADLWLLRRAALDQPFGPPELLPAPINSDGNEIDADLAGIADQPDRLELFLSDRRGAGDQLMRTTCATSP